MEPKRSVTAQNAYGSQRLRLTTPTAHNAYDSLSSQRLPFSSAKDVFFFSSVESALFLQCENVHFLQNGNCSFFFSVENVVFTSITNTFFLQYEECGFSSVLKMRVFSSMRTVIL